jgi:hypothetical protein
MDILQCHPGGYDISNVLLFSHIWIVEMNRLLAAFYEEQRLLHARRILKKVPQERGGILIQCALYRRLGDVVQIVNLKVSAPK